jgi:hypothetical protein
MPRTARTPREPSPPLPPAEAEAALERFIAKFGDDHQRLIAEVRAALRTRFPGAYELAYDNYTFFVIGYSPTERPSDAPISLVAGSSGVSICFIHGARLEDPHGLLRGSGKQTRFVRLGAAGDLGRPEIAALLSAATANARVPFRAGAPGALVIRSVSAKQRPRRRPAE